MPYDREQEKLDKKKRKLADYKAILDAGEWTHDKNSPVFKAGRAGRPLTDEEVVRLSIHTIPDLEVDIGG